MGGILTGQAVGAVVVEPGVLLPHPRARRHLPGAVAEVCELEYPSGSRRGSRHRKVYGTGLVPTPAAGKHSSKGKRPCGACRGGGCGCDSSKAATTASYLLWGSRRRRRRRRRAGGDATVVGRGGEGGVGGRADGGGTLGVLQRRAGWRTTAAARLGRRRGVGEAARDGCHPGLREHLGC